MLLFEELIYIYIYNNCLYVYFLIRPAELTVLKQPQIVHELTSVIREWGTIWKQLYIVRMNFTFIHSTYLPNVFFIYL